ncbi:hypothetical protein HMPREF3038_00062 [Akkermansia sp. KLE1797]|nr:hypothetical protein HMPREF3038_00062 [Akkermansia sp. KLE1797]KXU55717.1 hypothetical protein HMPREF3039_00070 [Akkermansia sp. KLE1798]KZA05270.1 hypothetical protein HMPREF1326_01030 [Akkermansia sp. KLE1605]
MEENIFLIENKLFTISKLCFLLSKGIYSTDESNLRKRIDSKVRCD